MAMVLEFPQTSFDEPSQEAGQSAQVVRMEDGFTRVPNELIEALAFHDFTKRQHKVIRVIERKTLGHNKRMDWISGSQFQQLCNLAENKAREAVAELVRMKVLVKEGRKVGFNFAVEEWKTKPPQNGVNNPKVGLKNNPKLGCDATPKRGYTKETLQKKKEIKPSLSETAVAASRPSEVSAEVVTEQIKQRPDAAVQTPNGRKWGTADDLAIARHMADTVARLQGAEASPLTDRELVGWADEVRRLRGMKTSSGRSIQPDHIRTLWDFAHTDPFWNTNLLSPKSLRKHWERLAIKYREFKQSGGLNHASSQSNRNGYVMGACEAAIARGEKPKAPPGYQPPGVMQPAPAGAGRVFEHEPGSDRS